MRRASGTHRFLSYALLPLALLAAGCSLFDTGYPLARKLQKEGIPAQARILALSDTGELINDDPVVRIDVEVRPADRPPYRATIERLLITNLEIPQYQPGNIIAVRFDPRDPTIVSIDLGPPKEAKTGDPFHDNFEPAEGGPGSALVPPPPSPVLYRGTGDEAADQRALYENGYFRLGASEYSDAAAPDPQLAAGEGKRVGAGLVVLYGFVKETPSAGPLPPLPFTARPPGYKGAVPPAAGSPESRATIGMLPPRSPGEHLATYWAKTAPPVLGVVTRPLDENERATLMRNDGVMVRLVMNSSPAAAAGLQPGDIILAVDGKAILDAAALPAFLSSVSGRRVRLDLLRAGAPLALDVQLN